MRNVFGGLPSGLCSRISVLSWTMTLVLVFGLVPKWVEAQTSRYTIDDVMDKMIEMDKRLSHVMDKVIEMDKRLTVVETEVKRNRELIETVNTNLGDRISATDSTMRWLFGFLGTAFFGILALTFATYRNTASLVKPTERSVAEETKVEAFGKELKTLAERERVLEGKLEAADRSVPMILEALEQKVNALAERQEELEGKLKLAEVI